MKRLTLTAALVGALLCGGTVWAIPPATGSATFFIDLCEDPFYFPVYDCGDFLICEAATLTIDWKLFFDENGDPRMYREKTTSHDGRVYEVGNPDNFFYYNPLSYTYSVDQITGDVVYTGLFAMMTVPGYGHIFRDVGKIVFDVDGEVTFEAGHHEYWNSEWEAVCALLETN